MHIFSRDISEFSIEESGIYKKRTGSRRIKQTKLRKMNDFECISKKAALCFLSKKKGIITVHFKAYQKAERIQAHSSSNTISTQKAMFLFIVINSCYFSFIGYNKRSMTFLTWSCTSCRSFGWWLSTMHLTTTWLLK